jgi:hypothetical protein
MFGRLSSRSISRNAQVSRRAAPACRSVVVEPLEDREMYSVSHVGRAVPTRGAPATTPAVHMSARPISLATAQRPVAGQQRLIVINPIAVLMSLVFFPTKV